MKILHLKYHEALRGKKQQRGQTHSNSVFKIANLEGILYGM